MSGLCGGLGYALSSPKTDIGRMEKKMETAMLYWGYIGIMEKKTETTVVYWGYRGIMEKPHFWIFLV